MTKNNLVILGDDNNSEYSNGEITSIAIEELHDIFEDEKAYWEKKYNHIVYPNQIEILNTIANPHNHYINIVQSRGAGKSRGVALAIVEQCINIPKLIVSIFAPKASQSKRLIGEMYEIINVSPKEIQDQIDKGHSSTMVLTFKNGSSVYAMSANEKAQSEGNHPCVLVLDESHLISDYSWSSKISPQLGSHGYFQIIKIGVAMGRGHFNKGFNDKKYINLMCPWNEAERLKESGIFYYTDKDGIVHEYSKYVVEALMPPSAKKKYFPDRPDLITGPGEVSELDWLMQYELQWLDSVSIFLSEAHQKKLASGSHKLQVTPYLNETYVFGLDTASGSPNLETLGLDYTALSIWQLKSGKILKVFSKRWQGDPLMQYDEILGILKKFRVKCGLIDFSSLAYVFVEMLKKDGIKCDGIQYHSTCPESHKDWKTTIFDNFLARLNLDQIYYPILDKNNYKEYKDNIEMMNNLEETEEAFYEWCILQRVQSKNSSKIKISAPNKEHDDTCLSGDTLIPLADGRTLTVKDISEMDISNLYTYSLNLENLIIQPGKIKRALKTGNKKVLKIFLDNEKYFECTEDHLIMMRDGTYKQAKNLKENDSLMPLYRKQHKGKKYDGYESVKCLKRNKHIGTHKIFVFADKDFTGKVVHHRDYKKHNNNPDNLIEMTQSEHMIVHNNDFWKDLTPEQRTERNKKGWDNFYPTKEDRRRRTKNWSEGSIKWRKEHPEEYAEMKKEIGKKIWQNPERHKRQSEIMQKKWNELSEEEKINKMKPLIEQGANARRGNGSWCKGMTKETNEILKNAAEKISKTRREMIKNGEIIPWNKGTKKIEVCPGCNIKKTIICKGLCQKCYSKQYLELHKEEVKIRRKKFYDLHKDEINKKQRNKRKENKEYNHKVIKIIDDNKFIDVYDIEVEKYHNFAIDVGIFVHNCNSDALACYAAIKASSTNLSPLTSIPLYVSKGATLYSGNNNFGR